jgi:MerR family mercuric resistance operon transcriptional regulator
MKKRIGDVAKAAGVGVETVRFYQRAGVLDEPDKPARGWRSYGPAIQRQLEYVRLARRMGLSVSDIAALKKSLLAGRSFFCRDVRKTIELRLAAIDVQIIELQRSRAELATWLDTCRERPASSECTLYRELSAIAGRPAR